MFQIVDSVTPIVLQATAVLIKTLEGVNLRAQQAGPPQSGMQQL